MNAPRALRLVLGWSLAAAAGLAIFLSWGALHELALHVGGMSPERAIVFPIVVDLPAVVAMLIALLVPAPRLGLRLLPWMTFGLFSVLTVLGNAASVASEAPASLALGAVPAIIVNAVPAVALLLTTHLAATTVFRVGDRPTVAEVDPRRAQVLELHEGGESQRAIAIRLGIARSTVARWIGQARPEVAS